MAIQYTPIGWIVDSTALSASNFNHMEEGIVNSVNAVNNILDGETTFSGLKTFDAAIRAPAFSAQGDVSEERGISYGANYILKFDYVDDFLEAYFDLPDKPSGEYTLATMNDLWEYVTIDTDEEIEGQKTFKQYLLLYDSAIDNNYHLGMNDDVLEIASEVDPIYFKIDVYNKCITARAEDGGVYSYYLPNESGTFALQNQVGTKLYKHRITISRSGGSPYQMIIITNSNSQMSLDNFDIGEYITGRYIESSDNTIYSCSLPAKPFPTAPFLSFLRECSKTVEGESVIAQESISVTPTQIVDEVTAL